MDLLLNDIFRLVFLAKEFSYVTLITLKTEFSTVIFVAYSKGCRIYIVSSKLLVRAPLSDVPRNNLKSGVATVALELGFRPRSTQL